MIAHTHTSNGWAVLSVLSETVDSNNVAPFKACLLPHLTRGAKLVLDLSQVEFMDSSALGALLSTMRSLESSAGAMRLVSLTPPVRTLFTLVRLDLVFDIMNSPIEATAQSATEA